jgi:dephospho-CoA kinase
MRTVYLIAGLPGSGKSTVRDIANDAGYMSISMGELVLDEAARAHININSEYTLGHFACKLRTERGVTFCAAFASNWIKQNCTDTMDVFVDGIRSIAEVEYFKRHFKDVALIAVLSSTNIRHKRMAARGRYDSGDSDQLVLRDLCEIEWGAWDVLLKGDLYIVNNNDDDIECFNIETGQILGKFMYVHEGEYNDETDV